MDVSREDAVEMLGRADLASEAVTRRAPKEHLAFIGWGLFNAVVVPGFDVFDRRVWGWVTIAVAALGFVATFAYFARRSIEVEVKQRSPWWTWPLLGVWMGLASIAAAVLDDELAFSYTLAGLVAAAPLFARGLRMRSRA